MKTLFTFILGFLLLSTVSEAQVVVTSTEKFSTRDQMLLANDWSDGTDESMVL